MAEEKKTRRGFVYYLSAESDPLKRVYISSTLDSRELRKTYYAEIYPNAPNTTPMHGILMFLDWDITILEWYDLDGTYQQARSQLLHYQHQWMDIFKDTIINLSRKERIRERDRKYRETHRATIRARGKARRLAKKKDNEALEAKKNDEALEEKNDGEAVESREKKYYVDNRDKILARCKAYRQANRDKIHAKAKIYRETHKEKLRAKYKMNYKKYNESRKIKSAKKRRELFVQLNEQMYLS